MSRPRTLDEAKDQANVIHAKLAKIQPPPAQVPSSKRVCYVDRHGAIHTQLTCEIDADYKRNERKRLENELAGVLKWVRIFESDPSLVKRLNDLEDRVVAIDEQIKQLRNEQKDARTKAKHIREMIQE